MEELFTITQGIVSALSDISAIGVAALSLIVVFFYLRKTKNGQSFGPRLDEVADNHLHEISETLKRIEINQRTMTANQNTIINSLTWVKAKMNGKNGDH